MDEETLLVFLEEASELVDEVEESLLTMENDPGNRDTINQAFRCFHTIKGGAGFCGADGLADYTHKVETLMVRVRDGSLMPDSSMISSLLESLDCVKSFFDELRGVAPLNNDLIIGNLLKLDAIEQGSGQQQAEPSPLPPSSNAAPESVESFPEPVEEDEEESGLGPMHSYLIQLRMPTDTLEKGVHPLEIFQLLQMLGPLVVIPHTDEIPPLETFNPREMKIWWSIKLETNEGQSAIEDNLGFYLDNSAMDITLLDGPPAETVAKARLNQPDSKSQSPLQTLSETQSNVPEDSQAVTPAPPVSPPPPPSIVKSRASAPKAPTGSPSSSTIRVAIGKLDQLVSLVGESILQQSRLAKFAEQVAALDKGMAVDFSKIIKDGARNINELRTHVMGLRMVPIRGLFTPLQRTVRDYAKDNAKDIVLLTEGEDTELDKTVIEQVNGPLNHLLRNAMDHGIEATDVRIANGKPAQGQILLKAYQEEGFIHVEIRDDGGGINTERVLAIAQAKGVVEESAILTEKEIHQLIFEPGFSTAEQVTDVSGRGVGMDVVRNNIETLGGSIGIVSVPGQGTTMTMKIPLTLAIIDGLLVKVADSQFILPLAGIEECIEMFHRKEREIEGQRVVKVRDEAVPYVCFREQFGIVGAPPDIEQLVIVNLHQRMVGFVVDQIIGEHRTVIKNLGVMYKDLKEYSGATILGDGTVVLILDLNRLLRKVEDHEKSRKVI